MKTLIVITGESNEIRLECHRFHCVSHESRPTLTLYAQDAEGNTICVVDEVKKAYFDKVVTHQKAP
jgi:hypothetical protein